MNDIRDTEHLVPALVTQLQRSVERNARMANALRATLHYIEVGSDTKTLVEQIKKALTGATDE